MPDGKEYQIQLESDNFECPDCKNFQPLNRFDHIQSVFSAGKRFDSNFGMKRTIEANLKYWNVWAYKGKKAIRENLTEFTSEDYHLIIVANFSFLKNLTTYASGIDLLIDHFQKQSIPHKIVVCDNSDVFLTEIMCNKAKNIWIFGHGDRHGVCFGKKKYFPYCKLKNAPKKKFIAQLHCSNGDGKALWEFIASSPGIFSNDYRNHLQNREDIKMWIKNNEQNSQIC